MRRTRVRDVSTAPDWRRREVSRREREAGGSHPQNSGRRDNAVTLLRLESRLTAAPRTGIQGTMCSVEARHPSVGRSGGP